MTVRELIEKLQAMPQDLEVAWPEGTTDQGGSYITLRSLTAVAEVRQSEIPTYMRDTSGRHVALLRSDATLR